MGYLEELLKKAKESTEVKKEVHEDVKREVVSSSGEKILVESSGELRIYRLPSELLYSYEIPVPHYRGEEKKLINELIEIVLNVTEVKSESFGTEEEKRAKYFSKVIEIIDSTPELRIPIHLKEFYANAVVKEMLGYGLIDDLVKDDNLEDILVLGPNKPVHVYHRKYGMMKTNVVFYDDRDIKALIERIARLIGRRIDFQVPMLDARLPDGTRINATIPPCSIDGSTISLRKFKKDPFTIIDLINLGTLNYEVAAFLWMAVDGFGAFPSNILVSGGTGSGKTTTLNILCSFIPNDERIITIEDTAELNLPLYHWIRFETRPAGLEGSGEITMNDLVKNSLRMRPDRIIVGEIRGEEGFTLFSAINTGHRGSMGTVHANSAHETLIRLTSPPISVPPIMIAPLNFIIMQNRIMDRRKGTIRRITEIAEVVGLDGDKPQLQTIYSWDAAKDEITQTGLNPNYLQTLSKFTGCTSEEVKNELREREELLKNLAKKGIRGMKDVCDLTQNYILRKRWKT